jgi:selenocysteine-specific elongation factor
MLVLAIVEQRRAVLQKELLVLSRYSVKEIETAVRQLADASKLEEWNGWLFERSWWTSVIEYGLRYIEEFHARHPELPGVRLVELKSVIQRESRMPTLFEGILAALIANGMTVQGHAICKSDFRPSLPARLQQAADRLRVQLRQEGLGVLSLKELVPDENSRQAMAYLVQCGDAVQLGPDIVVSQAAFTQARITVRRFLRLHGKATTSDLRQALCSNRRVTVPLLEELDRAGLTRRDGDFRLLR